MVEEKWAIVLDSNTFGAKEKYNFKKSKITIVANNFKDISNMDIFLPDIVIKELKKHIREAVIEAYEKIPSGYVKDCIKEKVKPNKISEDKEKELDKFIKRYKIKTFDCEKYLDIKEINEWYFKQVKPFEKAKPKEFPDAMIISAMKNYFKDSEYNEIIAVTDDNGFSGAIKTHTNFKVKKDIGTVMLELLGIDEQEIRKIDEYLSIYKPLSNLDYYSFVSDNSEDNIDIDYVEFEKRDIEILNHDEDSYIICVNGNLKIKGEFSIIDTDLSVFDCEDPECSALFYCYGNEIEVQDVDLYLEMTTDTNNEISELALIEGIEININEYINQLEQDDGTIYNYI